MTTSEHPTRNRTATLLGRLFPRIEPTPEEIAAPLDGDARILNPACVMDRAFYLPAPPSVVWPWLVQLGKARAGWYLPHRIERFVPRGRRALHRLDPAWQRLAVGDVIPDYGGPGETFTVADMQPSHSLLFGSQRGQMNVTWQIRLSPEGSDGTRMHLRLRLGPVRRPWLVNTGGELIDALTIAGLAAGLGERVAEHSELT